MNWIVLGGAVSILIPLAVDCWLYTRIARLRAQLHSLRCHVDKQRLPDPSRLRALADRLDLGKLDRDLDEDVAYALDPSALIIMGVPAYSKNGPEWADHMRRLAHRLEHPDQ